MGWTRRANPKWQRKQSGQTRSRWYMHDGFNKWDRLRHKQQRHADKLQIAHELEMYEEELQALWEDQWYDDDYNDKYFDRLLDGCYEYPEPEPEPEYDPYDDPYWFDDFYGDY